MKTYINLQNFQVQDKNTVKPKISRKHTKPAAGCENWS